MAKINYSRQSKNIISRLEKNPALYNKFKKWLNKQELDIEFLMYEDSEEYPKKFVSVYKTFLKSQRRKK